MPPATPRTMRLTASMMGAARRFHLPEPPVEWPVTRRSVGLTAVRRAVYRLELDEVAVDLAQRDAERLLLGQGLDERTDVLEQALTELAVVGVDLPGALGGDDHQGVLGRRALEQLVDGR